jgi:hypothetical protein
LKINWGCRAWTRSCTDTWRLYFIHLYPWNRFSREFSWFKAKPRNFLGLETSCICTWKQTKNLKRFRFARGSKPLSGFRSHQSLHSKRLASNQNQEIFLVDGFAPTFLAEGYEYVWDKNALNFQKNILPLTR